MRTLLRVQELDLRIESCKAREREIPKQKGKFDIHRKRLAAELTEREQVCKNTALEQRQCESEIDLLQRQVEKYDHQLYGVKKNEEYQALLHEIDLVKKQIALKEERIIALMMEMDDAQARLDEDRKRITEELKDIDRQCVAIDEELKEAIADRERLEKEILPLEHAVERELLVRYKRIRANKKTGAVVVALNNEVCAGCNMTVRAQMVNEVMAGKAHTCNHCGRLLYHLDNLEEAGEA